MENIAVIKAFKHVKEHHPTLSMIVFSKDGRWNYMDDDFESFKFGSDIDVDILQEAFDSIEDLPYVYQPNVPSKREILEEMRLHNEDEVGIDNPWTFEDAEYHLLLSDKYYRK